jgi:hypothetical protein
MPSKTVGGMVDPAKGNKSDQQKTLENPSAQLRRGSVLKIRSFLMTVRLNFGRHWFPFDKMGLKQFS